MTTWTQLITAEMARHDDGWINFVDSTATKTQLDQPFEAYACSLQGCPFTLWTARRVYFPVARDGQEWVSSVPRHPCPEATEHIGL